MSMGNPFAGIEEETVNARNYLPAGGTFGLQVKRCIGKDTRDYGPAFILEATVIASSMPEVKPVGSDANWFQSLAASASKAPVFGQAPTKESNMGLRNVKHFAMSLLGYREGTPQYSEFETQINPRLVQILMAAGDARNVFGGFVVGVETTSKISKKKGTPYTVMGWFPCPAINGAPVDFAAQIQTLFQRLAAQPHGVPNAPPANPFLAAPPAPMAPIAPPVQYPQAAPPAYAPHGFAPPVMMAPSMAAAPPPVQQYPGYTWDPARGYVPNGT